MIAAVSESFLPVTAATEIKVIFSNHIIIIFTNQSEALIFTPV